MARLFPNRGFQLGPLGSSLCTGTLCGALLGRDLVVRVTLRKSRAMERGREISEMKSSNAIRPQDRTFFKPRRTKPRR